MANRAETTITLTDAPGDAECAVITEGLRACNEAQAGYSDSRALAARPDGGHAHPSKG